MKHKHLILLICAAFILLGCDPRAEQEVRVAAAVPDKAQERQPAADISLALTPAQLDWVGQSIFQNECAGKLDCLVHWNEGEAFPSLGIGHFIWYPKEVDGPFTESFPNLVQYMVQRQAPVPDWLRSLEPFDAPWPDREAFLQSENSAEVAELREFLAGTQGLQAEYIFRRADESLKNVIAAAPEPRRDELEGYLGRLSETPGGVYALMDYVNFKGEGLVPSERYQGQGWGLLQVLLEIVVEPGKSVLDSFREAAGRVLTRRAENAEKAIERERWLPGWLKRLDSYREPSQNSPL
ncbi:hypothetical protein [Marinobacter sp.]|uniref:hypothetical protein n=1 Tax=Marinobacter sp. TaxID=50741 RepID=UPI003568F814